MPINVLEMIKIVQYIWYPMPHGRAADIPAEYRWAGRVWDEDPHCAARWRRTWKSPVVSHG